MPGSLPGTSALTEVKGTEYDGQWGGCALPCLCPSPAPLQGASNPAPPVHPPSSCLPPACLMVTLARTCHLEKRALMGHICHPRHPSTTYAWAV